MHARWSAVLFLIVACGSGSGEKRGHGGGGAAGGQPPAAAPATGPLTAADCERLLDHWFELVIADKKKTARPDEVPTDEDVAKTRARLSADTREKCVGSPREPYDCSMKAQSTAEIRVCLEGGGK